MSNKEKAKQRLIENITKVSGWGIPDGMMAAGVLPGGEVGVLKDPDPAPNAGKSLNWIDRNDFSGKPAREVYQKELEDFGDGVYLESKTARALQKVMQSQVFRDRMISSSAAQQDGSTRWAYRPPIVNILAGGIDDSYHLKGQAVDIRHDGNWGANSIRALQDIVVQALKAGFRGIGFGSKQFHFDTRQNGFMGYVYSSWNLKTPNGKPVTPSWILASCLCDMDGLKTALPLYRDGNGEPIYKQEQIVGGVIKSVNPILDSNTGFRGEGALMSNSNIEKYINNIKGQGETLGNTGSSTSLGTIGGLTALAALIIGGIYGFRRFLRNRREQAEAQKIAMDQKKRVVISRFRSKNARLIRKAKNNPEVAAQLEQELRSEFELFGLDID
jgi:hypothetical protein